MMKKSFGFTIVIVFSLALALLAQIGAKAEKVQAPASIPQREINADIRQAGTVDEEIPVVVVVDSGSDQNTGELFIAGYDENNPQDKNLIVSQVKTDDELITIKANVGDFPTGYIQGSVVSIGYTEGDTIPVDVVAKYNLGPKPTAKIYYWIGDKDGKAGEWNADEWVELEIGFDQDGLAVVTIPAGAPNPTYVVVIDE